MDWNAIFADPDFQALPQAEKHKALREMDPDFAGLPPEEMDKAIAELSAPATPEAPANPFVQVAQQAAGAALKPFSPEGATQPIAPASGNPLMAAIQAAGQTLQQPARISPTLSQPGQIAGEKVNEALGGGMIGKAAGFATGVALDPQSYALGPVAKGVGALADDAAGMVGNKVLAPAGEILSATKIRDIKRLFENPMEVLTANLKKSGQKMGELEKTVFNVTDDEARMIGDAARTPEVGRTIVRGLIAEGKARAKAAGRDPLGWAEELTPGELIAARRGASKLTTKAQGGVGDHINIEDLKNIEKTFVKKGQEKALEYLSAVRENSMAQTRQQFLNLFPRNQNMSTNALRGFGSFGTAVLAGPLAALGAAAAQAPLTTGVATLATKGAYEVGKRAGGVAAKAGVPTTLAAIREYLQKGIR